MTHRILVERPEERLRWQFGASERDCRRFVIVRTLTPLNSD